MKISKVIIEGMHNVTRKTYNLNDLTYLHGPNGAGKSTVMQAIQLALLGYIPGTSKASKEAIFRHANGHLLAVTLFIEDGDIKVKVSRVWSGTKSNINSSVEIEPADYDIHNIIAELELPIFNFNEFMHMTANKLKDWFIDFLPAADVSIDWKAVLTEDAEKAGYDISDSTFIDDAVAEISNMTETGSDLVRAVNEKFKTALSFKKKEQERAQSTIQSLIYYDDLDETLSESEIESQIKEYESFKKSRDDAERSKQHNARVEKQLADYEDCKSDSAESDPRYVEAQKAYAEASESIIKNQNDVIKYRTEISELDDKCSDIIRQEAEVEGDTRAKKSIIDSEGICPFTSEKCNSVQPLIAKYQKAVEANNKKVAEFQEIRKELKSAKSTVQDRINDLEHDISCITDKRYEYSSEMANIQNRYSTKKSLSAQLVIIPDMSEDDRDFDALIAELRELQVKYAANKRYNDLIDKLTAEKFNIDQEIAAYKSWINLTGVNGSLQGGVDAIKPFLDLELMMDKYIQAVFGKGVQSKFNLQSKANSFSFGIERDDTYIPFNLLSSGEKCMYTLALMMSLTQSSSSPLKVVMVDDLLDHLDDVNINKLFEALKTVDDIQMIFAGVKSAEGDFIIEVTNE